MPLFKLGQVVATRSAMDFCHKHQINPLLLIGRHIGGDWGDLSESDVAANVLALEHDLRLFSSYQFPQGKVWVITEADRSTTTVLLPEDY